MSNLKHYKGRCIFQYYPPRDKISGNRFKCIVCGRLKYTYSNKRKVG